MIGREEVLHVARLARLRLPPDEEAQMQSELSSILGHIDRIGELDLEGVEPTTHVEQLENVFRPDVPQESLSVEVALEAAPDAAQGAFRVPSPQADAEE